MSLPADLALRHILAQQAMAFFGYGPKGKATVVLQGRFAVFTSALAGPGVVAALAAEPFGRLCMRYINHLYVERGRAELERIAMGAGVRLLVVGSDIDFDAGLSVGIALAEQSLPGALPEHPDPELATRLGAAEAAVGPVLVTAWLPQPLPEPDPDGAWLRIWADRSAAAARVLRSVCKPAALATFVVPAGQRCLAGALLAQ